MWGLSSVVLKSNKVLNKDGGGGGGENNYKIHDEGIKNEMFPFFIFLSCLLRDL